MSGGVDSSMCAKLLQDAGHEVQGCYMKLHAKPGYHEANIAKVRKVGEFLGIKIHILDLQDDFNRDVYEPFVQAYISGLTPNPCALCNRRIKLGKLLEFAREQGFERLATGHYVRIEDGLLKAAVDLSKDQSYFLANIDPAALEFMLFPLGGMYKKDVKEVKKYPDFVATFMDLENGRLDAVVGDRIVGRYYMSKHPDKIEERNIPIGPKGELGIAFAKDNTALRDEVQKVMNEMKADGTAAKISEEWFQTNLVK